MLNPNAEPYVCLYAYQAPDPYIPIPTHYPSYPTPRAYRSHVGFHQLSSYKCSWYYPPSLTSLTTFEATTTSTCTSRFDRKKRRKTQVKSSTKRGKRAPEAQTQELKLLPPHKKKNVQKSYILIGLFRHRLNLGYAFVNFTTARAAKMLYKAMNKSKWDSFGSKKICEITYASIQGKEALEGHFRKKNFKCDSEAYLPILLSPPRNGSTSRPIPSVVGILRGRFSYPRI